MEDAKKMRFRNVYQNLPLNERKNTIVILGEKDLIKSEEKDEIKREPISWDIAFIEIDQETEVGDIILNKLIKLNLI